MTTQTQGKGKKKNKEVNKISLDEFNSIDAPHGHSVVSVKVPGGLDWAATMANYDQSADTHQIVVPVAPRAQRGPNIDYDSLPNEPPFRASLYNLPMSVEEEEIADRFLSGLSVLRVDLSSKSSTTVEFETKQDLYDALSKDGVSFKGKTVNVCLYGQTPQNSYSDRGYGGRGGNSSYNDRYDRPGQSGGFGGSRMGDRYERSGFGNRDRDGFGSGYQRAGSGGGFGGGAGGGYDRFQDRGGYDQPRSFTSGGGEPEREEPTNWRDRPSLRPPPLPPTSYNNGSRQPYTHSRPEPYQASGHNQQYQHPESFDRPRYNQSHNQPPDHSPHPYNDRSGPINRPLSSAAPLAEERPKLIVQKRTKPLNVDDVSNVARNAAIFGDAKPSSKPYEKMKEVEEKLSSVHLSERKISSQGGSQIGSQPGSQAGSQPGSAPRSRQVSERS